MKKRVLTLGVTLIALFLIVGCGGGGTKKDATFYKDRFKKATTIQALHTKDTVIFTLNEMDKVASNQEVFVNQDIQAQFLKNFKNNLLQKLDFPKDYVLNKDTPIILPKGTSKAQEEGKTGGKADFADLVKMSNVSEDGWDCCHDSFPCCIIVRFITHLDDDSGKAIDIKNDKQKYLAIAPKDDLFPQEFNGTKFVEIQAYRNLYNEKVDKHFHK